MALEFRLPVLGENIDSIQVVRVLVAAGGSVAADQPVLELETDKATIEVPSSVAGRVAAVHVQAGERITSGQLIFTLAGAAADAPDSAPPVPVAAPAAAPAAAAPRPEAAPAEVAPAPAPALPAEGERVPAAPSVRRFARELGVALERVAGSGPHGRVSREDVMRFVKQANERPPAAAAAPHPALPDFTRWGAVERQKMSLIRAKTAEHLARAWARVPHVTIFDEADITELEPLRLQYAELAEKAGGKLSMAVMVCKIAAQALRKFPLFNASVDMAAREIILKRSVHLGIAVNTPRGLMVPVVRDADTKNMVALAAEIQALAQKCRAGKITVEELEGSTFTVTNLGRICGTHFTPIVNDPEVAILGLGRAHEAPAVGKGAAATRLVLPLSLSFDHRVIDGADGAAFMGWIKEAIRQPLLLALNG